jgi:molecular chaperone GrpE
MDKNDLKTKKDDKQEKKEETKHIEELKQKTEELENNYKRALADYQNLEKRVREERNDRILRANKDLLLHLLPVLDTLMLAKKHIKVGDEGLDLSIKQFHDVLKNENVERIETQGANFDPHLMECIESIEGEEGKVLEEIRTGYKLHDTVLRAALVKVGKKKMEQKEN